ncbi:MAG: 4Fe-4S dicluster domain-containing protein [Proteobacteria bacterium]|nr:4Fe-4S dicluster domain-containing protein [Pseudomonadota bacterium]
MTQQLYVDLAEMYGRIGFGGRPCQELYALLEALFNEEEARLALNLSPFAPEPPEKLAERLDLDPQNTAATLDLMADKGLIYCSLRGEDKWYKTIQLVPGIFELQFMKGEYTPRAKELAKLFDAYFHAPRPEADKGEKGEKGEAPKGPNVHFARVIPIEKTVTPEMEVFPYEEARRYIDQADTITVSVCYCRHERRLLDHGCEYPDDVCLQFGSFARFVKERGFGREITHEEAHRIMVKSSEAGLIATSSNTREKIDFICNCCTCCCGILRSVVEMGMPAKSLASNYLAEVDPDTCTGCEDCLDRCQMDAIVVEDVAAQVNLERCIGCGVCVPTCPSESLTLFRREDLKEPPRNFSELITRQAGG